MTPSPQDIAYVQNIFREYYRSRYLHPYLPVMLERREFGYMHLTQRVMIRHLSFRSFEQLREALINNAPAHVYRSAAIYRYPEAPMEEKGWMGAELIFDIDADHLDTPCKKEHDFSLCTACGSLSPSKPCGTCGSGELQDFKWVCDTCLNAAKSEMLKLLEFMENDFGIPPDKTTVSFSGNRGYHLSVHDEAVMSLSRDARQEIVEYVSGLNIDPRFHGLDTALKEGLPDYSDPGWRGRIARESYGMISKLAGGEGGLYSEFSARLGQKTVDNLRSMINLWQERPRWDLLGVQRHRREAVVSVLVEKAVHAAAAHVDTVVTTDVHRLLRLSDTINGKTGLRASVVKPELLEEFDPLTDSLLTVGRQTVKVRVIYAPEFRLGEDHYGPFRDEVVSLQPHVATYLICRGVATLEGR